MFINFNFSPYILYIFIRFIYKNFVFSIANAFFSIPFSIVIIVYIIDTIFYMLLIFPEILLNHHISLISFVNILLDTKSNRIE